MKQIALLLILLCTTNVVSWSAKDDNQQIIPIPVLDTTVETGKVHRSLPPVPIQALYDGFSSVIMVTFLQNLGEVEVTLTNLFSGNTAVDCIDSRINTAMLPVNLESGFYQITFLTSSGASYYGVFEIDNN